MSRKKRNLLNLIGLGEFRMEKFQNLLDVDVKWGDQLCNPISNQTQFETLFQKMQAETDAFI